MHLPLKIFLWSLYWLLYWYLWDGLWHLFNRLDWLIGVPSWLNMSPISFSLSEPSGLLTLMVTIIIGGFLFELIFNKLKTFSIQPLTVFWGLTLLSAMMWAILWSLMFTIEGKMTVSPKIGLIDVAMRMGQSAFLGGFMGALTYYFLTKKPHPPKH